jgi:hypothetical protein
VTTNETKSEAAQTAPSASTGEAPDTPKRPLTPEARRALAEAEERRRNRDAEAREPAVEKGGQAGPDPVRYGDWEKGGIISDF